MSLNIELLLSTLKCINEIIEQNCVNVPMNPIEFEFMFSKNLTIEK